MEIRQTLPLLICGSLIIFYFVIVVSNSVNIPNGDDLYCLLLFTQEFQDAPSWTTRFELITQQWVEHRIVYSRFTALLSYWITGQVNFIAIIIIGNMTLVGFTALFWKLIKRTGVSMYYLIPVVLILFSPVMYEANVWAGACTVYMPVCFLGLLTIYLLVNKPKTGFVTGLLTALLATFSFGNGMFAFFAGLVVLIYLHQYRLAVIWAFLTALSIFLYFRNYEAFSATDAFGVAAHFEKPLYLLYNLFGFSGGIFDSTENSNTPVVAANIPAILIGGVLISVIIYGVFLFAKGEYTAVRKDKLKVTWLGMILFVGITTLVMTYSRSVGEAMNTLSSRYKIYSMVIFLLVYLWCLMFYKKKTVVGFVFGGISFVLLIFNYYVNYQKITNYNTYFSSGLYNYNENRDWLIYSQTSYYDKASLMISDSIRNNRNPVYNFDKIFPEITYQTILEADQLKTISVQRNENCYGKKGGCISFRTDAYPTSPSNRYKGIYLIAYNKENIYLFVANPFRNGRLNMIKTGEYFQKGFTLDQDFSPILKAGTSYQFAVFCPTEKQKILKIDYRIDS